MVGGELKEKISNGGESEWSKTKKILKSKVLEFFSSLVQREHYWAKLKHA